MMDNVVRIGVGLLLAGLLWAQVRRVEAQPHRRRAFALAAGAVLALTGYNIAVAAGAALGALLWTMLAVALALFVGALGSLLLAWRSGEARQQQRKFRAAMQAKIEERERALADKGQTTKTDDK